MADEDPYNFEISIPSAAPAGGGRARAPSRIGKYGASNSSEEEGDDDGSPDVSDLDDEEDDEEDYKPRSGRGAKRTTVKPAVERVATAGGGGNALDKAKDFLSRYSSKPVATKAAAASASAAASARRSRVELSLDDDDLSLDSPRDVSRRAADSVDDRNDDASSYFADESPVKMRAKDATKPVRVGSDREDEYDEESDAPPPFSAPPTSAAVSTPATTSTSLWKPAPTVSSIQVEDEDEDEVSEEAESIASQSEIQESHDQSDGRYEAPQPVANQPTRASAAHQQQSAPSESGVYEEDAFDEEPVAASPVARSAVQSAYEEPKQTAVTVTAAKAEPAFDYSMDFSDDGDDVKESDAEVAAVPTLRDERDPPKIHESSDGDHSEGEQSAYLESGDGSQESPRVNEPPSTDPNPAPTSPMALKPSKEPCNEQVFAPSAAAHAERVSRTTNEGAGEDQEAATLPSVARSALRRSDDEETEDLDGREPTYSQEDAQERPIQHKAEHESNSASAAQVEPRSGRSRPRVVIVRAYETPGAGKPEMRDASTQFTGNHAGIQTELVPDGMHNLLRSNPPVVDAPELRREVSRPATSPPPPNPEAKTTLPTASPAPLPSYSLEILQQPLATATSLYKQQLVALQEQILAKKRETERLVSERMSFQYGSLRGTERFIAGRRPPKLQLWEALMHVDPTLSEQKAKEAARLAQGGFTA